MQNTENKIIAKKIKVNKRHQEVISVHSIMTISCSFLYSSTMMMMKQKLQRLITQLTLFSAQSLNLTSLSNLTSVFFFLFLFFFSLKNWYSQTPHMTKTSPFIDAKKPHKKGTLKLSYPFWVRVWRRGAESL